MCTNVVIYVVTIRNKVTIRTGETVRTLLYLFRGQNYHQSFGLWTSDSGGTMIHVDADGTQTYLVGSTVRTTVWK